MIINVHTGPLVMHFIGYIDSVVGLDLRYVMCVALPTSYLDIYSRLSYHSRISVRI